MSEELELEGGNGGGSTVLARLLEDEMRESFIDYSMSVIVQRALPDVRDGLKPVHRRILYAMSEAGMNPGRAYKKSATVVGDVLGKYHPHGDLAVYEAMVRMVQEFSLRHPLVDGQGNFGSIDGDRAAAYRYTEARLTSLATELLADIEKDTVDFTPNFDDSRNEPSVLPSKAPNLLVNGSSGIAVGMATNIPPHNLREIVDACAALIDNPDLSKEETNQILEGIVLGPDFPTGGFICGTEGISEAYRTGRGRIVMRARAEIEEVDANTERIIVTEIPFMVNKSRLIEQIAQLVRDKKLTDIRDMRDESDRDGMRIVIELKRDAVPHVVLNRLYKHTQMQSTFGTILLALHNGQPKVMSLQEILGHFIDHRHEVIVRRTEYDLNRALDREHILEGLKVAVDNIDEVIKVIRGSKDTNTASQELQSSFNLTERQAKAILDMRLARLTGLEIEKLEEELSEVRALIEELREILGSEEVRMGILKDELREVAEKYGNDRRSEITAAVGSFNVEDLIVEEDMVVTLSHQGYVKRLPVDTYRAQRRGGRGLRGMDTKEEDWVEGMFIASTHDYLMIFTRRGQCYWKKVWEIPVGGRTARGKPIINLLNLGEDEQIAAVLPVREFSDDKYLLFGTRLGVVKKTALSAYGNVRTVGLNAINIRDEDELIDVQITSGEDEVILASRAGKAIRFHESDARPMGRATEGVRGLRLRGEDIVVGMVRVRPDSKLLVVSENGLGKRTEVDAYRLQKRGGSGVINLKTSPKTGQVVAVKSVQEDEQLMVITRNGVVMRQPVSQISLIGRATQGVKLVNLDEGDSVVDVARLVIEDENGNSQDEELAETLDSAGVGDSE
ncbi:MAG: DNA gyrase subunit A [Gemmatimonadota bacterium]|nr:DNA gyrase subunit A [Gemmatimonadota bacterium]|tara:strand:+ start:1704 stop:4238 length:2535 start_codon:yes stop_codon:yes gene_type:complete